MSVVVDANLVAALLLPLPYSQAASRKLTTWRNAGEELVAPTLMEYEVCSTVRRLVLAGWVTAEKAPQVLVRMRRLDVRLVAPTLALHQSALSWAVRLGRSRTYDTQYMALAEHLRVDLWTADLPLARSAHQAGANWVHCIQEP